jgi:formate hydrogenlyase subunit 6/NADH:ubiquinone oxidoreductase subunit I
LAFRIDLEACINCSLCRRACPTSCIAYFATGHRTHIIDPAGCIDCDLCVQVCPMDCIDVDPEYVHVPEVREAAKEKARQWARRRRQETLRVRETIRETVAALGR